MLASTRLGRTSGESARTIREMQSKKRSERDNSENQQAPSFPEIPPPPVYVDPMPPEEEADEQEAPAAGVSEEATSETPTPFRRYTPDGGEKPVSQDDDPHNGEYVWE